MRLRIASLSLLSLFVLAACSDEAPLDPASDTFVDDPIALEDELFWNEDQPAVPMEESAEGRALKHHSMDHGVGPTSRSYEITIENLTANTGDGGAQVFSPPILATHKRSLRIFRVGRYASEELAGVAEDAMNDPLVARLKGSHAVNDVQVGDGVIPPGASSTYQITTRAGRRALSAVFMLVNTNDGFGGIDALHLPAHGEVEVEVYAYDAGSEANDELMSSIPGPCCGSVGAGTETRERIEKHRGIRGVGDLDPEKWGWDGPVARVTVRRLEPAFEITLRNLTPDNGEGSAQVFSPPVFASHTAGLRMFRVGRFASDELSGIAEDAMNDPMVDLLTRSGRAFDVQVGGGVIFPGSEARYEVTSAPGYRRLSMAFMLVNTNDGFSGIDRVRLPRSGSVTYRVSAYDAGSEANDELLGSIPGPCCGSVGTGAETHERIKMHPGILGVGDLSVEMWGWEGPVAEIEITRVR